MSVTACRSCDQQITFIQAANGRWRPVEVTFEELVLEGREIATEMIGGVWTETGVATVRIYSAHLCPENPVWNRGRPRTRTVDESTGEVTGDEPEPEPVAVSGQPYRKTAADWERERQEEWLDRYMVQALYPCGECGAEVGEVCKTKYGAPTQNEPHRPRKIASYFTEGDDTQPWPPRTHNAKGMKIMREWLSQNAGVLTGEEVSP